MGEKNISKILKIFGKLISIHTRAKVALKNTILYATCSAAVIRKNASFMKPSRVNPPAIAGAPPPPTAHNMLRTP